MKGTESGCMQGLGEELKCRVGGEAAGQQLAQYGESRLTTSIRRAPRRSSRRCIRQNTNTSRTTPQAHRLPTAVLEYPVSVR